jgi:membrane protease subunit HflC
MPIAHSDGCRGNGRRRLWQAGALGLAGALPLTMWLCSYIVYTGEYALLTEFGKPVEVVTAPGLRFKYPYQTARTLDARVFAYAPPSTEFLTLEKTPVVAASTVLWRIEDPTKFFQTVFDRAGAESRLGDILFSELGAAVGRNPLTAFVSVEPAAYRAEAILEQVAAHCREIARRNYGIDVVDVQLRTFDFPKQNRLPVYSRMKSERGRMSMKYRSEGEEEGLKIRAEAEQERTRIVSDALKLAQRHRGEGEGKAAQIYAGALSQGPDFYRFVRSTEAARNLLPKGATLVLPANSELFGLLEDSSYYERNGATRKVATKPKKE